MLNKTHCRRKKLFGGFLSYSDIDIHVKGSKCCDICAKDCDYGICNVKEYLLSLQIVAIDLYFNLTLILKYTSGRLSFFI